MAAFFLHLALGMKVVFPEGLTLTILAKEVPSPSTRCPINQFIFPLALGPL